MYETNEDACPICKQVDVYKNTLSFKCPKIVGEWQTKGGTIMVDVKMEKMSWQLSWLFYGKWRKEHSCWSTIFSNLTH